MKIYHALDENSSILSKEDKEEIAILKLVDIGKYVKNVTLKFRGRSNQKESDAYLREELEIKDWLPQEIEEEELEGKFTFDTSNMGNENFPRSKVEEISSIFLESWGQVFLNLLTQFYPFQCHVEAVKSLEDSWNAAATSQAELAKDAMFKGLGIYWTLKEEYTKWNEENLFRKELGQDPLEKTETCKAWEIVLQKELEFRRDRARRIFAKKSDLNLAYSKDEKLLEASESIFSTLRTQAFVTGFILALASLKQELKYSLSNFQERAEEWLVLWNEFLLKNPKAVNIFNRRHENAFLRFSKLDSPYSVYFRYLAFEMLYSAGKEKLDNKELKAVKMLVGKTRILYLDELVTQQVKALKKTNPEMKPKAIKDLATSKSKAMLEKLCKEWFSVSKNEFSEWLDTLLDSDQEMTSDDLEDAPEEDINKIDEIVEESDDNFVLREWIEFED